MTLQPTEYPSPLPLPFKRVGEPTVGGSEKCERPFLEPVFGLSILGYSRNMAVQHGVLCGRGPAPYVDTQGSL